MHFNPAATALPASGIREIVNQVFARGPENFLRLEIGEPDFDAPENVRRAAAEASQGPVRYTPSTGIMPLREALASRLTNAVGMHLAPEQVIVCQGAVQGVSAVFHGLLTEGDEVLIPDPSWPNYEMLASMVGAKPVLYPLREENLYLPDVSELEALISPRTKILVINSPGNPTGAVFNESLVQELVEMAARHGIWVVSDEVYDELIFEGTAARASRYNPDGVIGVYSFSKTYAMTGYRIGYVSAPRPLADLLMKLQEPLISCCSAVSQLAGLEAISGPQNAVDMMRATYRHRRDLLSNCLSDVGLHAVPPAGAFYQMVPLTPGADSRAAALNLLDHGLAVAPGSAFGKHATSFIRLSLASDDGTIQQGVKILAQWAQETNLGANLTASER